MTPKHEQNNDPRPRFMEQLSHAYGVSRKNLIILTGDTQGKFWSTARKEFCALEPFLRAELRGKFTPVHMDISSGISFYDKASEAEIMRVCESEDGVIVPRSRAEHMRHLISSSKHNPLPALVLLKGIQEAFVRVRKEEPGIKPLCVIIPFAGALFPAGSFSQLGDLDRQRLVHFLTWMDDASFTDSPDLVVLINGTMAEINGKIIARPHARHLEIALPNDQERTSFVHHYCQKHKGLRFEGGRNAFVENTAGLKLTHLLDLLEESRRLKQTISRSRVIALVNEILQTELGEIIRVKYPSHKPKDIIGYKQAGAIFTSIFERCSDPETAVSAVLVSGPNGAGKTFQLEAHAAESGRVVIELAGIRGSYFGETDRFFELLRWHIATFGKILILVDEAHTAFGSVHASNTHETEMRLAGNIIKMMGDPRYLGKLLWGLMTSRPDELDPDVKSRAPLQIPIFDLEGDERREFVHEMFRRKHIDVSQDLNPLMAETDYYSARDYRNLVAEVLAQKRKQPHITVIDVLSGWHASRSIKTQREFQSLIASQHCSYPNLLPEPLKQLSDAQIAKRIEELKWLLAH